MNTNKQIASREIHPKTTAATLFRLAGLAMIAAGLCYVLVGLFHPQNIASSIPTTRWEVVHYFAIGTSFFGLFGIIGVHAKQAEKTNWLGMVGFVMLSLWFGIVLGVSFIEAFILPILATTAPTFVEGFVGIFTGSPSEIDFGILPMIWTVSGPLYMLGGLLFGFATYRAGALPRWAGVLLATGTMMAPVATMLPGDYESIVAIPVGLALAWLGYALWTEQAEKTPDHVPGKVSPQLRPAGAE